MSFLPLVRIWIWVSVLASAAGWLLSALGQMNKVGYAVFGAVVLGGVWAWRKAPGGWRRNWGLAEGPDASARRPCLAGLDFNWRKLRARFRRWLPAGFAGLAFLVFLGATVYPPTTHEGLTCRVPRVLHWLAGGHWHWIITPNARLNDRPCGLEWMAAPLLLFTRSDRFLFLVNFIPWLCLPGLIFSVFTRLGVRPRVAWHWMWLLPTGYNFLLQSGSLGNDTTPAFYALAAMDFGLRAWASRRTVGIGAGRGIDAPPLTPSLSPSDGERVPVRAGEGQAPASSCVSGLGCLWLSILSAAFLTATKVSDLPLLLPCAVVVLPLLPLLLRRPAASCGVAALAATVSLLPSAALNILYSGDWTGLAVERSVIEMKHPLVGVWGNALLLLKNLAPPIFPLAGWWNQSALTILPHGLVAPLVANFEPGFHTVGELPTEDGAGLGFGVSFLLIVSVAAASWLRRKSGAGTASSPVPPARLPKHGDEAVPAPFLNPHCGDAERLAPRLTIPLLVRRLALVAPWISLLAYFVKAAMMDLPRHLSAYYPLLFPLLLVGAAQAVIVRRRWWRALAGFVLLLAVPVVVLVPGRPLWPAQTILSRLAAWKPNQRLLQRALTVYSVYGTRSDPLANVRALLPHGLKVVGFMGTADDLDISLWRPFGSRRIEHILLSESSDQIRQRHTSLLSPQISRLRKSSRRFFSFSKSSRLPPAAARLRGSSIVSIFCKGIAQPATSTARRLPYSSYLPSQTNSVLSCERGCGLSSP